ncbi:MAG: sodium-translocating pyrophosphatase [Candidatus Omnitrophota bacterium]|nr:sodium-translocating pyrophosphatase [Candidatus Omnitrophota bacterium]
MNLLWLPPIASLLALGFVGYFAYQIIKQPEGTDQMKAVAYFVRQGSRAYLKRQYSTIAMFFAVVFCILLFLAFRGYLVIFVPFAFLMGGFFSGLCGYVGMNMATYSSARTANAARESLNSSLRIAFRSGAIMGLSVVGIGLIDLTIGFWILNWYYRSLEPALRMQNITSAMLCFGMGASSMALFARVGGGIFTKAADVGADLVGKIEANIPEDDPRNPAVIADNVGDNVGDVAGMGADLYESYVGSIIATMALAVSAGLGLKGVSIPLAMAAVGVLASIIGIFFVRTKQKEASQAVLLSALRRGIFISAVLIAAASYFIIKVTIGAEGHIGVYGAVLSGLIAGLIIGLSTEYFTSPRYRFTRSIAENALTGPATVVLGGLSVGMLSTAIPVITVAIAVLASYYLSGGTENFSLGIYGVGISAVGMLSTLGVTLASDAYGPVADNAGGNAQMTDQPPEVRERTDALDSLGNTTAATGKGFAIGSAALTALALIAAYRDQIGLFGKSLNLSLMNPHVIVGLFIGGMLPFLFCSMLLKAVGRAAGSIVVEVRRQFREIKGLMEGKVKPDYARCVDISTRAAQKEMILPALMAIIAPILIGLLIGVEAQAALLIGALISGFVLAIMMANSGGAWDNAKKFIEEGSYGGKGSPAHKAAVVGDIVGDPFKDTSGPSLNILLKLMSMVSLVFASFVIRYSLFK